MTTPEQARDQVVQAADALFYARGIQQVGMDAVRTEAGVSLKRIYQLFPSKEDLVVAVLQSRSAAWTAGIEAAEAAASDPRERVLAIFDFLRAWFAEGNFHGCAFINTFGELAAASEPVAHAVRAQKQGFRDHVLLRVREAGAPDEVGGQIALLAEGAQVSAAILGGAWAADEARSAAATLLDAAVATVPSAEDRARAVRSRAATPSP